MGHSTRLLLAVCVLAFLLASALPAQVGVELQVAAATMLDPLDVDGNGEVEALTDGLLLLRYLFGFRDGALVAGAVDTASCTRCDAAAIEPYIASILAQLDVDGDGEAEPLTDGLLLLRYFFGFRRAVLVGGAVDVANCTRCTAAEAESFIAGFVFVCPPADLNQVAVIVPRGNVNAVAGGHVRPVKHMYLEYLTPRDGGTAFLDVDAMAAGRIVMVVQRQTEACVMPDHTVPSDCATGPGATALIDEYELFIQHTGFLTSYYDHLHSLDPELGLPDWQDDFAGWVRVGPMSFLLLGDNGAMAPVPVDCGQRLGATRNYFTTWDIGVVDTRRTGAFLGTGLLRYPSLPEIAAVLADSGVPIAPPGPDHPFPGEMFVNSACFTDSLTPALATAWRAKLAGDGSCGRPDWDVAGTLQGNWYRADVTAPTLENMFAAEENALSFSPYNYDPANQTKIGFGANFLAMAPPSALPAAIAAASERLAHGLLFTTDRTPGTRRNPDPLTVPPTNGHVYACFDAPDRESGPGHPLPLHSVVVYLPIVGGQVHLKLRYFQTDCPNRLSFYDADLSLLDSEEWWGDYVR